MPSRLPDFEAVALLSNEEQRWLLREGDAQERVWAAWSLGMQSAAHEFDSEVHSALGCVPPAGTRMHLAAILAGLGDHELVQVMAEHDTAPSVRAVACPYLAKTTERPNTKLAEFLAQRLLAEGSEVRLAVLVETIDAIGPIGDRALLECGSDSDRRVRALALETAKRQGAKELPGFLARLILSVIRADLERATTHADVEDLATIQKYLEGELEAARSWLDGSDEFDDWILKAEIDAIERELRTLRRRLGE